ncbi:MAG: hypothetical protein ABI076_04925 [Acidobacteriaceae bacterium]
MDVTASAVVAAVQAYSKINATGPRSDERRFQRKYRIPSRAGSLKWQVVCIASEGFHYEKTGAEYAVKPADNLLSPFAEIDEG